MRDPLAEEVQDIMDYAIQRYYDAMGEKGIEWLDTECARDGLVQIRLPRGGVKCNIITTWKVEIMSLPPVNDDD